MSEYRIPTITTAPSMTRAPLQFAVVKACSQAPLGLTMKDLVQITGVSRGIVNTMIPMMVKIGRLFAVGTNMRRRYFESQARAEAMTGEVLAMLERERAARQAAAKAARKEYNRERHAVHMDRVRAERAAKLKTAAPDPAKTPLKAKIYAEILRRKRGAVTAQIHGATDSESGTLCRALSEMHAAGTIWRVGNRRQYVYFATRADFDEFGPAIEQKLLIQAEAKRSPRHKTTVAFTGVSEKRDRGRHAPDGPVVVPGHVKPQILDGYRGDCRYAVTGPVIGGFVTMGIGRYLDA